MKTWEMIKELTENPEKKFKRKGVVGDVIEVGMESDEITWLGSGDSFIINSMQLNNEWEEVKEPMTFIEAVNSGKLMKHETWADSYLKLYDLCEALSLLPNEKIRSMLNGKWYIAD
ncbi:hypothetical protein [Anaerosalibacter massiliensis]|uniref:hypothetical protein n=1 Tax=Anaerosalibacter massiliensis TaxID=1347392 RepID=UPI0005B2C598|nr:hypothetical protein [Anaerosalibacter massiliensis]